MSGLGQRDSLAHGIGEMANDRSALQQGLAGRRWGEGFGYEVTDSHDLIVQPQHVLFNALAALGPGVTQQIANHAVVAIEGGVNTIESLVAIFYCCQLLLRCQEAKVIHFSNLPGIISDVSGAQNQHTCVSKPIRKEYGRDNNDDDTDSHSDSAPTEIGCTPVSTSTFLRTVY